MNIFTNRMMKLLRFAVFLLALISATISIVSAFHRNSEYKLIFIWPLCFLFFLLMNYRKRSAINQFHYLALTLIVFTQMVPRYVVYPVLVSLASEGFVGTRHIVLLSSEINYGILIVAVELLCFSFFVFLFELFASKKKKKRINLFNIKDLPDKKVTGNKYFYCAFIILALTVYIFIGYKMNIVQFISIGSGYSNISENAAFMLVKYIVSIGITMVALLVFARQKNLYKTTNKNVHFIIALLAGLALTMVIVGESRGTQITIGIIVVLILIEDYPKKKGSKLVTPNY